MSQSGLGEQALNKAAEMGLASQLDESENLEVIKTDPLKLVQGQVDTIEGDGLVMQKDLRMEEMEMQMVVSPSIPQRCLRQVN